MLGTRLSLFSNNNASSDASKSNKMPTLKLHTDREVYRPGDSVCVTVEISNPSDGVPCSLLVERLGFEIRGIEKLDTQWFAAPKPLPGSKQRKGEYVFMDCSASSITTNQIVSSGASKAYVVRTLLPGVIPPSYRGATIRYLYYVKSSLFGRQLILENGHFIRESTENAIELEARIPLQIWVTQKSNGLAEGHNEGIVPASTIQLDMYWKEMDDDSEWIKANDMDDRVDEGYESSRDEILSVSSYNLPKGNINKNFGSSLSLQSTMARSSYKDIPSLERGRSSLSSALSVPLLSAAEIKTDPSADVASTANSSVINSASQQQKTELKDNAEESSFTGAGTSDIAASEGFIRGRSYNIRANNQVLLRYSPKNSDSTYYFSDMIGGTLTFFHGEGDRRCLEVSVSLETSETISRNFVHPSRKNSPTITKVQSDHHEVVADLVQTSFQFSIPMDGPMSFSTPRISVQWALRFEFLMTPENVDWRRYEHPLLVEGRDKCEWLLPIVVHAPPPRAAAAKEKPFSMDALYHT